MDIRSNYQKNLQNTGQKFEKDIKNDTNEQRIQTGQTFLFDTVEQQKPPINIKESNNESIDKPGARKRSQGISLDEDDIDTFLEIDETNQAKSAEINANQKQFHDIIIKHFSINELSIKKIDFKCSYEDNKNFRFIQVVCSINQAIDDEQQLKIQGLLTTLHQELSNEIQKKQYPNCMVNVIKIMYNNGKIDQGICMKVEI